MSGSVETACTTDAGVSASVPQDAAAVAAARNNPIRIALRIIHSDNSRPTLHPRCGNARAMSRRVHQKSNSITFVGPLRHRLGVPLAKEVAAMLRRLCNIRTAEVTYV